MAETDPGVPTLLRQFSELLGGEQVELRYSPPPANEALRWRIGSRGREWGKGQTPYHALQNAFSVLVDDIFTGRLAVATERRSVADQLAGAVAGTLRAATSEGQEGT